MSRAVRSVHFLCPICHYTVNGEITFSTPVPVIDPQLAPAAKCPMCYNTNKREVPMIDVDALNIPALAALHRANYTTFASCDRVHDGLKNSRYNYDDDMIDGYYNGPFVGVNELTDEEAEVLAEAAKIIDKKYEGEFVTEVDELEDDDEGIVFDIGINGKNPGISNAIKANSILTEFIELWLQMMANRGIKRDPNPYYEPDPYSNLREMQVE